MSTNPRLAVVPKTEHKSSHDDAYALRFGHMVLSLLDDIPYGLLEIHKHARDIHKFRTVADYQVPDDLKVSQSARRREQGRPG